MLFWGPPFASSSASVFCWRGFFLDFPTQVALLAGSLRSASPVLFSVSGLSALVPVVQVCLRAARVFCLVAGSLSAGFVWGSGFTVLLFILLGPDLALSLSLSRPFLLQPLAPGVYWLGLVCLGYFHGLDCPSPSHGVLPIGIPAFLTGSLPVALSHLPGGVRLFCFAGRPSSPFFWLSGALVALPGSLLFILPGFGSLSSQFPVVGLVLCFLPCGLHPVSLSLFGLLAVPQFLLSQFLAVCFPGLWVSLFPGSFLVLGSSFPVLVFYSFLLRGTAVASGSCLLLLWGASSYSHVWSLVSVSCDGFSGCSVGSKVFSLPFLTLFSVALSPV